MTNFLPAGFLQENLEELRKGLQLLKDLVGGSKAQRDQLLRNLASNGRFTTYDQLLWQTICHLSELADDSLQLLGSLPSDPLIYTGQGTTEEVIMMLERLLYKEEQDDKQHARDIGADD